MVSWSWRMGFVQVPGFVKSSVDVHWNTWSFSFLHKLMVLRVCLSIFVCCFTCVHMLFPQHSSWSLSSMIRIMRLRRRYLSHTHTHVTYRRLSLSERERERKRERVRERERGMHVFVLGVESLLAGAKSATRKQSIVDLKLR